MKITLRSKVNHNISPPTEVIIEYNKYLTLTADAALGRAVRRALNRGYWTASDLRLRTPETPSIHSLLIAIADAIDAEQHPA